MHDINLRPYQLAAIEAIEASYHRGVTRQAIAMPTGSGKTVVFSEVIRRRAGRALVLAHRDELIGQAVSKLRMVMPAADIGVIKAAENATTAPVVVASVQTLARPERLAQLAHTFTTVVIDEAHHAAAATYRAIIDATVGPSTLLLGVSATLQRTDGVALSDVFDAVTYEVSLPTLIEQGYLSDIRAYELGIADIGTVAVRGGDFVEAQLEGVLHDARAPEHAVEAFRLHAPDRTALLFAPTVRSAASFAAAFKAAGLRSALVHGGMPTPERQETLDRLGSGQLDVLSNCMVLTEGFDEPRVDCIINARPTTSTNLYTQMVGRGTRLHPGKEDLLVLDLVSASSRAGIVTTATLLGLPPAAIATRGVVQALAERREAEEAVAAAGRIVARQVELFNRRDLHWVRTGDGFSLSAGNAGLLVVRPEPEGWSVTRVHGGGRERLATRLELGYAQGFAEDFVRTAGTAHLNDRSAAWRTRPASDRQRATLRRMRIPVPGEITSGEASDLIAGQLARGRR